LLSEALFWNGRGNYIAFSSLFVEERNFFGRSEVSIITPHLGLLAGIPCIRPEMGQFCTALAIEEIIEQLKMYRAGAGHVLRTGTEVIEEISIIQRQGWNPVLLAYSRDETLANAAKWGVRADQYSLRHFGADTSSLRERSLDFDACRLGE
jgi:hypothetical protein